MLSKTASSSIHSKFEQYLTPIPAGQIELRDDRKKQTWTVAIQPFLLAKFPVTQALYASVMQQNPSNFPGPKKPVETVSWVEAAQFCNTLSAQENLGSCYQLPANLENISFNPQANGYRLPNEAEWEYACKAGSSGSRYGELTEIAWYKENSGGGTHEVGQKQPNAWGLYDMLGNVWEWCSDIYDEEVYGSYRIIRGGGWADAERGILATNRRRSHPVSFKIDDLGFRVARNWSEE